MRRTLDPGGFGVAITNKNVTPSFDSTHSPDDTTIKRGAAAVFLPVIPAYDSRRSRALFGGSPTFTL